jgi:hypothetical protein
MPPGTVGKHDAADTVLACGGRRPQRAGDAHGTVPRCRRRSVGRFHDLRLRCSTWHEGMTHVWNDQYRALYNRTNRVLYDAGINEKLADELATHRTLAVALKPRGRPFPDFVAAASDDFKGGAQWPGSAGPPVAAARPLGRTRYANKCAVASILLPRRNHMEAHSGVIGENIAFLASYWRAGRDSNP